MTLFNDPAPVSPEPYILADRGAYFVSTNPTPGTAIAFAVNAAVSETAGYFLSIQNTQSANGRNVYLDYLRLICSVVPASATAGEVFIKLDTTGRTGGGTQCVPVNANYGSAATSAADVWAGALTTAARSAARLVARAKLRTAIPVAGDEWHFSFGGTEFPDPGPTGGAATLRMPIAMPPMIIPPAAFALVQLWFPGNAATPAQFEFELGIFER